MLGAPLAAQLLDDLPTARLQRRTMAGPVPALHMNLLLPDFWSAPNGCLPFPPRTGAEKASTSGETGFEALPWTRQSARTAPHSVGVKGVPSRTKSEFGGAGSKSVSGSRFGAAG